MLYAWLKLQCVPVLYFLDDEIFLRQFASAIKKGTLTIQGLLDEIHRGRKMPPLKIIKQLMRFLKSGIFKPSKLQKNCR